jgi:hypothetical protein
MRIETQRLTGLFERDELGRLCRLVAISMHGANNYSPELTTPMGAPGA